MKRRAGEAAKLRRPLKRGARLGDGLYSSTLLYLKFLLLWAIIILADFILEFRFEFLWPFWMLLRSVYDSFKYQGLAFSMFFVCIALTSDMICFFFIPVQWVFFAASTYVWVQYIWYTDKGICLPTMILCSVFVYMEAGVRLRDLRHMPAHLDLCRPFAAHCIGYPVVTLGFGFKSYVGYRMRKRRQQEVARENSFYMQLLQQALPPQEDSMEQQTTLKETEKVTLSLEKSPELQLPEKQMNGSAIHLQSSKNNSHNKKSEIKNSQQSDKILSTSHINTLHNHSSYTPPITLAQSFNFKDVSPESVSNDSGSNSHSKNHTSQNHNNVIMINVASTNKEKDLNSKTYSQVAQLNPAQSKHTQSNGVVNNLCAEKTSTTNLHSGNSFPAVSVEKSPVENEKSVAVVHPEKETLEQKSNVTPSIETNLSENEISCEKNTKGSLKSNLKVDKKESNTTSQRDERRKNKNKDVNKDKENCDSGTKIPDSKDKEKESESSTKTTGAGERSLRAAQAAERQARAELTQLKQQVEQLTSKLNSANASRQADRIALATAEQRLSEEKRARQAATARIRGLHKSGDCGWEWCRQRRGVLEQDANSMREEIQQIREHNQSLTQSLQTAEQQVSTLEARTRDNGAEAWVATVKSLHERCLHLECSLSAETRVKLDLFSAVGEAKRQLDLREDIIRQQDKENEELKAKIAQMVAVMPNDSFSPGPVGGISKLRLSDSGIPCYPSHLAHHNVGNSQTNIHTMGNNVANHANTSLNNNMSNLDPNATVYTPKGGMVQCGPAAEA